MRKMKSWVERADVLIEANRNDKGCCASLRFWIVYGAGRARQFSGRI